MAEAAPGSETTTVGTTPPRPDGRAKVTGEAAYVDDIHVEGAWYGHTVRRPVPRARIVRVDASAVADDPEVVVVTAADVPGDNVLELIADDWPVLAADEVRHANEPIALVAAPTREAARRAAEAVVVELEELPAAVDLDAALSLEGGGQTLASLTIDHGEVEAALAEADVVLEATYETGHQEHVYIEPQGVIAIPHEDGTVEIVGSMQCPYYVHKALGRLFGEDRIRVRQAVTGGGFGGKEDYPDMIAAHATLLAQRAGRPVKIVYERHEDIVATTKRHPSRVRHRTGVTRDGKLVAVDVDVLMDGGAYVTLSPVVLSRGALHAAGPYACPNVRIRGRVVATNTPTNGAFRGFGAPQTQFAAERHMDALARELGLDPLTIRERNAYQVGDVTPTGQVLSESVSALECLREAAERTRFRERWLENEARRSEASDDGAEHAGIGLSLFWHGSGFTGNGERNMRSPVRLRLGEDGRVEVRVSSTDFGQGTVVVLAQIVADAVGVSTERVRVVDPDTAEVPDSGPTVASRTVMVVGGVLERAGATLAGKLCELVAEFNGLAPGDVRLSDGDFRGPGDAVLCCFADGAEAWLRMRGELDVVERFEPPPDDEGFDEETYRGTAYPAYGWGCDVVEIGVDSDTLAVKPKHLTMVCDVGKAIHPTLCKGQVEGGTLQAIGHGYLEEVKLAGGLYQNDRLSTYIIPTTLDTPAMDTVLVENPAPVGPQGAKGVGELPMDGGAAALVQAVENATGIRARSVPATPERLLDDREAGHVVRPHGGVAHG